MNMDNLDQNDASPVVVRPRRRRRALVTTSVVLGMIITGIGVLPTVATRTEYRNTALNSGFRRYGLSGQSDAASGGWFSPFKYHNVRVTDANNRVRFSVREVRTSQSLLDFLSSGDELGTLTLIDPVLEIDTDADGNLPFQAPVSDSQQTVRFIVENGAFRLSVPWRTLPIVDVSGLQVTGGITRERGSRWLTVDPIHVLDHEPLTQAHTEQNVALIAPVLSQTTSLEGDVSVWLEQLHVNLDTPAETLPALKGRAQFHSVEARLKPHWAVQMAQMMGRARGHDIADRIEIVRNSSAEFEVTTDGIQHSGLILLLPEMMNRLQVESSGLLGFDESLDLTMRIGLPQIAPSGNAFLNVVSRLVAEPLKLKVKGTVENPELITPPGMSLLDQVGGQLDPAQQGAQPQGAQPQGVSQAVFNLIQSANSDDREQVAEDLPGSVIGLIRSMKTAKDKRKSSEPPSPDAPR